MRFFVANLSDLDGESHQYFFEGTHLWKVTDHIANQMRRFGDFMGHKRPETVGLEVHELTRSPASGSSIINVS